MPRVFNHLTAFAALLLVSIAAYLHTSGPLPQEYSDPAHAAHASVAPLKTVQDARPVAGVALNVHHISDIELYRNSIDAIDGLGANALIVITPMFQQRVDSTEIRRLQHRCPTDAQLIALFEQAKQHEMFTMLMPIVLLEDAGPKQWRGVIEPADADAWWNSYTKQMLAFADLATQMNVDLFCVGSELNSMQGNEQRWQALIDTVRKRFDGQIAYTANWDAYVDVPFWDAVDVMAVSAYFELARDDPGADVQTIAAAWQLPRDALVEYANEVDKPLLLSEVGYPSLPWANAHPWNYVAHSDTQADHQLQARCWQAFFDAWSDRLRDPDSPAAGVFVYHWDPYRSGGDADTGYGIAGKPAFNVIKRNFSKLSR